MLSFSLLFFFSFLSCGFSIPSQKPQAIIHIGPHATGSTSFQRSLNIEANKEAFKKNGFWVAMESESFVHGLKKDSSSSSPNDRKFNQLVQTIKEKKRSFILSSEEFDGLTSVSIKALEQILEGYDVVIVAFHRQPTDHLRSLWAQANKMEQSPLPFAIWANEFYTQLQSVDLLSLLGQFSETFGEKSIKLLSFEGSLEFSNPFSVFVKDVLHLPLDNFDVSFPKMNESPNSFDIDVISAISRFSFPNRSCLHPSEISSKGEIRKTLNLFPRVCKQPKTWDFLLQLNEMELFSQFGKPLPQPTGKGVSNVKICTLDFNSIVSSPELHKSFADFASFHGHC